MKEPQPHTPAEPVRRDKSVRRSLWLLLLLLVLTQYPLLTLFNDGTPFLFGFPRLFCYLGGVFLLFFVLFILLASSKE
ncbi:MAG: hypothetical protein JXQ27_09875 [Acidobacteria bacterium]|nr:hypothetical protein [Acidobacteriota bacterium]